MFNKFTGFALILLSFIMLNTYTSYAKTTETERQTVTVTHPAVLETKTVTETTTEPNTDSTQNAAVAKETGRTMDPNAPDNTETVTTVTTQKLETVSPVTRTVVVEHHSEN